MDRVMGYADPEKNKQYKREYMRGYRLRNADKIKSRIKECWKKNGGKYLEQIREYRIRRKYGITGEDYKDLLETQGGVCKICQNPPNPNKKLNKLYIEHDHETGRVRGLVCHRCNQLIAALESPYIDKARQYIEEN